MVTIAECRLILTLAMLLATAPLCFNAQAAGPDLSIDAGAGRHPISDGIYGMNYADEQLAAELRLPVRRWGGNSTSRYNWQTSMHNTGSDWYFENIPDGTSVADGSASDRFIDQDRRTGTKTLMTVPLIGWTPSSDSPRGHPYACGFPKSRFTLQQSFDPYDTNCGNGMLPDGKTLITGTLANYTSIEIGPEFVTSWINHLTGKYGTAANSGVAYYNLDNEPMLWNITHHDVHPEATTYEEMLDKTYLYAAAVKAADPSAKTLGPVLWGWCAYFYSAADGCGIGADYQSHGNTPFVPWYLQQMKAFEQQHGVRILDYLDLHNYPQASGNRTLTIVRTGSGSGSVSADPGSILWNGNRGTASYPDGTFITLTAYPVTGSGSVFNNWSGACTGETTPCTFTISSDTTVTAQFDLITDFTAVPTSGSIPLYVCFSDASINNTSSWLWNFGDGESADTRNPCHTYIAAGSFGVSLTSSGAGGAATRTRSNYISASACANKPVRISGGSPFSDIQSACDKAANGDTIEAQALVFDGGLTLSNEASVTLKGGYICDYSANPMFSTIHGPLTIGGGALSLDRVVIQ